MRKLFPIGKIYIRREQNGTYNKNIKGNSFPSEIFGVANTNQFYGYGFGKQIYYPVTSAGGAEYKEMKLSVVYIDQNETVFDL